MPLSEKELDALLHAPREALNLELKEWIDPSSPAGIAKIARACMAMRNNNGGYLVIGFDDDGKPTTCPFPDAEAAFHSDVVQKIVGAYSAVPFAVETQVVRREGWACVVISIPAGFRSIVAAKSDLTQDGKHLVRDHAVYVRTVNSNGAVSTSTAGRGDWERIAQLCFDNREADIGAFFRRHMAGVDLQKLRALLDDGSAPLAITASPEVRARRLLNIGWKRFNEAVGERELPIEIRTLGFREVAVVVDGKVPEQAATVGFIQRLFAAQPNHTGWPPWLDSRSFNDPADRLRQHRGGFEALLAGLYGMFAAPHVDFWRINPKGRLYVISGLEDDLEIADAKIKPGTQLEFVLQIWRVAEAISVALAFGRAMGCDRLSTSLVFAFRWSKLKGRRLSTWANPSRMIASRDPAYQDALRSSVMVPLDTPQSAIAPYVEAAIRPLFALFGGRECESRVIEDITREALKF